MIDTTKFEGHRPGPWSIDGYERIMAGKNVVADVVWFPVDADARLIAAAPDLLAEVIRLRAALYSIDRQLGHDDRDDALRGEITAALEGGEAC